MGKIVTIPTGVNFSKSNIDVGSYVDLGVNEFGNLRLDISNVNVSRVRYILNEATTTVVNLCKSNKVNRYSLFCPDTAAPHALADFAGYNHDALPPTHFFQYLPNPRTLDKERVSLNNYYVDVYLSLQRGERYPITFVNATEEAWQYVKVICTFTENGTGTIISGQTTTAVASDGNPGAIQGVVVRLNDTYNGTRNGILQVQGKYMTYNNVERANIEDIHQPVTFIMNGYYIDYLPADYSTLALGYAYARYYNLQTHTYRTALYGDYTIQMAPQIRVYETTQLPTTLGATVETYMMRYQYYTPNGSDLTNVSGLQPNEVFDCFYIGGGGNYYKVTRGTKYVYDAELGEIRFKTDYCYDTVITKVSNWGADS